jgi:hypothetical protein
MLADFSVASPRGLAVPPNRDRCCALAAVPRPFSGPLRGPSSNFVSYVAPLGTHLPWRTARGLARRPSSRFAGSTLRRGPFRPAFAGLHKPLRGSNSASPSANEKPAEAIAWRAFRWRPHGDWRLNAGASHSRLRRAPSPVRAADLRQTPPGFELGFAERQRKTRRSNCLAGISLASPRGLARPDGLSTSCPTCGCPISFRFASVVEPKGSCSATGAAIGGASHPRGNATKEKTRHVGGLFRGVPTGIRTPVLTVKGWCPRPG